MTIYVVGRYTLKNEGTIILIKLQIMINFLRVEQYSYKKLPPNLNRITSFDLSDNDFVTWFSLERFANATVKIYQFSHSIYGMHLWVLYLSLNCDLGKKQYVHFAIFYSQSKLKTGDLKNWQKYIQGF